MLVLIDVIGNVTDKGKYDYLFSIRKDDEIYQTMNRIGKGGGVDYEEVYHFAIDLHRWIAKKVSLVVEAGQKYYFTVVFPADNPFLLALLFYVDGLVDGGKKIKYKNGEYAVFPVVRTIISTGTFVLVDAKNADLMSNVVGITD